MKIIGKGSETYIVECDARDLEALVSYVESARKPLAVGDIININGVWRQLYELKKHEQRIQTAIGHLRSAADGLEPIKSLVTEVSVND